ncbi:MAG: TIGR01777 family protein [Caldilineaceae bacterium SB0661_bin_32]|uniref:TIGR01777 family protein n=1 Tax=Caldilineaceae bacterium SB0661_bin_32 TaxID=2605255 RepID=A0A6B1D5C9_9CHLR|nr:TIGR01777 family protein [Caldilineaceae bacterium SB0661_bin_32]
MRILIAGGTGLIGSALANSLAGSSCDVTVLTRSPERHQPFASAGVQLQGWDGETADGWGHLVSQADAIVNLAGAGIADGRWTSSRKELIRASRVSAGQALVTAIRDADTVPKVLIQSSAVGYYGPAGDRTVDEQASPGTDFLARVCVDWESSTEAVESLGVRRVVIRTGVVLSALGGALPRMTLPFRLFAGGPLGSGKQYFPWIHIADEVAAIRFLLENERASGPYNLAAPNPPRNREFVRDLGRVMGRPSLMPTPSFALQLLFGEMSTVLLDGQRAVPSRLQEAGYEFIFPEPVAALRDLL